MRQNRAVEDVAAAARATRVGVAPTARARAVTLAAIAAVAVAWASAGAAPALEAMAEALTPADFTRDFVTASARFHLGQTTPPEGEDGNSYARTIGAPEVALLGGPYHLHPPVALLPLLPLVPLGYRGAAMAWLALSVVALGVLARTLPELARPGRAPRRAVVAATFFGLLLWPAVLHNLAKGQWSIVLAALVALALRAMERRRPRAAGLWLGAAASLKLTPVVLLGYLLSRHRRAATTFVGVIVIGAGAGLLVAGVGAYAAWARDMPRDVAVWQTWNANTASLNGLFARLLTSDAFARPLVAAPALARAAHLVASIALLGILGACTWRSPPSPASDRALGAAWLAALVLLNPLAWTHTQVLALPALALLVGAVPLPTLLVPCALMTVPRQTLAVLAGPTPVGPMAAPLLSLHAFGLLLVFVLALRAARIGEAPASVEA